MIKFETVPQEVYHGVPSVVGAVERLNSVGYSGVIGVSRDFRIDETTIPLVVVNPVSRSADEPLSEFESGFIIRTYGAANGQRFHNAQVFNALVAEITGMPVIGVPLPDRDWSGTSIPDVTGGWRWHTMSNAKRTYTTVGQLDAYANDVLESVEKLAANENASGIAHAIGESAGAAISLSVAHLAKRRFDPGNVSIAALPNVEKRHLHRELFIRDFATSDQGMHEQVHDGPVQLKPLSLAAGFGEGPKTKTREIVGNLGFMFRDMFGFWPVDPKLELYRTNMSLARTLTMPIGLHMIERLVRTNNANSVAVGYFENDKVARYEKIKTLGSNLTTIPHTNFALFEGVSHTACMNPYIVGYMASLLTKKTSGTFESQI